MIFQTTVSKLRDILAATGRGREDQSLGLLAAIGAATDNRRVKFLGRGAKLTQLLDQLNGIVATEPGPSTVSALLDATRGLQSTAPDLVDALHQAVEPMRPVRAEARRVASPGRRRAAHRGGGREALNNHIDRLIQITHDLTPVVGVLANNAAQLRADLRQAESALRQVLRPALDPESVTKNMRANLSFTPMYTYTRADCPQYGELKGPSC